MTSRTVSTISANAIATAIATRALSPRVALLMSAMLNLLGAFLNTTVAATVGKGFVAATGVTLLVILAALGGAIAWNLLTWYWGLPSSSSHSLIGGLVGAGLAHGGMNVVLWRGLLDKLIIPGLLSPIIGLAFGFVVMVAVFWALRSLAPRMVNASMRRAQIFSAAFVSFTHGSNDAQKTMGILTLMLVSDGALPAHSFHVPFWVIIASASAIALGTYSGGWRIIRTVGTRIIRLAPPQGFAAETAAGSVLLGASLLGFPVSTTHVVSGAIMGVGATRQLSAVRWGVAGNILIAWVLTLPAAACAGAVIYLIVQVLGLH